MKKTIFLMFLLLSVTFYAQDDRELNVGINGGIPIDEGKIVSSFAFGVEANYLFDDWFEDFKIGPSLGLIYYTPKEVDGVTPDAAMFLPIAISARFQNPEDKFYIGLDLGYGLGLSPDEINSGLYFKPSVGAHLNDNFKINLFYSGVTGKEDDAFSYLGLGLEFNIFASQASKYSY